MEDEGQGPFPEPPGASNKLRKDAAIKKAIPAQKKTAVWPTIPALEPIKRRSPIEQK